MSFTLTVEIPALDRLCAVLEQQDRAEVCKQIEDEIVAKMREAVENGAPKPKFEEVEPDADHPWAGKAAPEPQEPAQEPPKLEQTNAPAEPAAPAPVPKAATLADVQKAAAQMRDEGKLNQVTGMFGEFGIKKLSDLKGDALLKFAERLRQMGAKI
jgi:hypothetical protein